MLAHRGTMSGGALQSFCSRPDALNTATVLARVGAVPDGTLLRVDGVRGDIRGYVAENLADVNPLDPFAMKTAFPAPRTTTDPPLRQRPRAEVVRSARPAVGRRRDPTLTTEPIGRAEQPALPQLRRQAAATA
jgi:hypothetical protein